MIRWNNITVAAYPAPTCRASPTLQGPVLLLWSPPPPLQTYFRVGKRRATRPAHGPALFRCLLALIALAIAPVAIGSHGSFLFPAPPLAAIYLNPARAVLRRSRRKQMLSCSLLHLLSSSGHWGIARVDLEGIPARKAPGGKLSC